MANYLWLCAYGEIRSVTGAKLFGGKSAGLYNRYHTEKPNPLKQSIIEKYADWADEIYIFNDEVGNYNTEHFKKYWPQFAHKIKFSFQIRDLYGEVGHPELVKKIKEQLKII